jgi:endoribonuclease Dicer
MNGLPSMSPSTGRKMTLTSDQIPQTITTALATRTTEDVIADLKRPIGSAMLKPSSHLPDSPSAHVLDEMHFSTSIHRGPGPSNDHNDPSLETDNNEDEGDDINDEILPSSETKKISERKRRMNAIADRYIQNSLAKSAEMENQANSEDEAQQSTKWLVNQSENREIISTPREYQTELFERAKEKNIIAVLDTGLFHI